MKICSTCSREFEPWAPTALYCSRPCANVGTSRATAKQRGDKLRGAGTGGYYLVRDGRREHRVVAEQMLGRPLELGEHVHHINGDGRDNRPENLQIVDASEHARIHAAARTTDRCCETEGCGRPHRSLGLCHLHYMRAYRGRRRAAA